MSQREEIKKRLEGLASNYEILSGNAMALAMNYVDALLESDDEMPEWRVEASLKFLDKIFFASSAEEGRRIREKLQGNYQRLLQKVAFHQEMTETYRGMHELLNEQNASKFRGLAAIVLMNIEKDDELVENAYPAWEYFQNGFPALTQLCESLKLIGKKTQETSAALRKEVESLISKIEERGYATGSN